LRIRDAIITAALNSLTEEFEYLRDRRHIVGLPALDKSHGATRAEAIRTTACRSAFEVNQIASNAGRNYHLLPQQQRQMFI
jgi:hypothetical protein